MDWCSSWLNLSLSDVTACAMVAQFRFRMRGLRLEPFACPPLLCPRRDPGRCVPASSRRSWIYGFYCFPRQGALHRHFLYNQGHSCYPESLGEPRRSLRHTPHRLLADDFLLLLRYFNTRLLGCAIVSLRTRSSCSCATLLHTFRTTPCWIYRLIFH